MNKKEATQETHETLENVYDYSFEGVAIDKYENEEDLHGSLGTSLGYELEQGCGVYVSALTYFAISTTDLAAIVELPDEEFTEDVMQNLRDRRGYVSLVYTVNGNRSIDDVADYLSGLGLDISGNEFLGTVGEYNFYYQMNPTHTDLPSTFTPTTYFVNSDGYIIGEVVIGTRTEAEYTEMFNQALAAVS
jgi:hypothetical protein